MKKTIAFVLAMLLMLAVMPSAALAEETVSDGSVQQAAEVQGTSSEQRPEEQGIIEQGTSDASKEQEAVLEEPTNAPAEQAAADQPEVEEDTAKEAEPAPLPEEEPAVTDAELQQAPAAAEPESVPQPEFYGFLEKYNTVWFAGVDFYDVDMSAWAALTLKITKGGQVVGEYKLAYTPEEVFGESGVYSDILYCGLIEDDIWQVIKQIPDSTDMTGTVLTAIAVVGGVEYTFTADAVGEGVFDSNLIPVFSNAYLTGNAGAGWKAGFDFKNVDLDNWTDTVLVVYRGEEIIGVYGLTTPPAELFDATGYFTGSLSFGFDDDADWEAYQPIPEGTDLTGTDLLVYAVVDDVENYLYAEATVEPEEPEEPAVTPEFFNAYLAKPSESGGNDWSAGVDFKNVDLSKWTKTTFRVQKGEEVIGEYVLKTTPSELFGTNGIYSDSLGCGLFADEYWDAVKQIKDIEDMTGTRLVIEAEVGGKTYTAESDVTGEGTFGKIPELFGAYLAKPTESGGDNWNAGVDFKDVRLSRWTKTTLQIVKGDEVIGEYVLKTLPSELFGTSGVFSGTLSCGLFADEHWDAVKQIRDVQDMAGSKLVVNAEIDGETYTAEADAAGEGTFGKIPEIFNAYLAKPTESGGNNWNAGIDFKDVRLSRWTKTTLQVVKGDEVIGEYELKTAPSQLFGTSGVFSGTLSSGLVADEHWTVEKQIPGNTDMAGTKLVVTVVIDGITYTAEAETAGDGEFVNVPYFANAYLAMPNETGWNAGVDFKNVNLSQWTKTSFRVLKGEKVIGEYVLTAAPSAVYGTDGRFSGTLSSGLVQDSFWKAVRQIPGGTDMTGTKLVVTAIVNGVTYTVTANATGAGKFVNIPEVVTAPPKTGDDSRSLSGLLLMLSGLILAAAVLRNRKEQAGL